MLSIQNNVQLTKPFALNFFLLLLFVFSFAIPSFAQKKANPTIGKKELEISIFHLGEIGTDYIGFGQHLDGTQIVHRWSLKKNMKVGIGGLVAVINHDPIAESNVVIYGALFGDVTGFIGPRQKWSVTAQIGHGIFNRKREFESASIKAATRHSAGMYYSISLSYRSIISKKILLLISPTYTVRYFREKTTQEIPSVEEYKSINKYAGPGIRVGIIF